MDGEMVQVDGEVGDNIPNYCLFAFQAGASGSNGKRNSRVSHISTLR